MRLNAYFDFDVSIDNDIAIDGARCMFPDKVMQWFSHFKQWIWELRNEI